MNEKMQFECHGSRLLHSVGGERVQCTQPKPICALMHIRRFRVIDTCRKRAIQLQFEHYPPSLCHMHLNMFIQELEFHNVVGLSTTTLSVLHHIYLQKFVQFDRTWPYRPSRFQSTMHIINQLLPNLNPVCQSPWI